MGCDVKCSVRQSPEKNRLVDLYDDRTRTDTYIRNVRIRYAHALKKRRLFTFYFVTNKLEYPHHHKDQ